MAEEPHYELVRTIYNATREYALDEERRAQFRLYNFALLNILLITLGGSEMRSGSHAWFVWPVLAIGVNALWLSIGFRLVKARRFWNGTLRLVENVMVNGKDLDNMKVFARRDSFFDGQAVVIMNQKGETEPLQPPRPKFMRTTQVEGLLIPALFLVAWLLFSYSIYSARPTAATPTQSPTTVAPNRPLQPTSGAEPSAKTPK